MQNKEIYHQMVNGGYKLTKPRKLIAKWIVGHKGVFSALEICRSLTDLDRVTIYRTIKLFCSLDIIHTVLSLNGEQYYERHATRGHHHHIVCTMCKKSECVPCEVPEIEISSFKKIHHSLVFTGLCDKCTINS
ncbi:hypothetical protein GF354_00465 [Candidatus Peregrinibacteria bacterium]|nr:hypothetical protein [Candidatus Peregrinibacteria bacterium]